MPRTIICTFPCLHEGTGRRSVPFMFGIRKGDRAGRRAKRHGASRDPALIEPTTRQAGSLVFEPGTSSTTSTGGLSASSSRTPSIRSVLPGRSGIMSSGAPADHRAPIRRRSAGSPFASSSRKRYIEPPFPGPEGWGQAAGSPQKEGRQHLLGISSPRRPSSRGAARADSAGSARPSRSARRSCRCRFAPRFPGRSWSRASAPGSETRCGC
jgi:hypothetical protein